LSHDHRAYPFQSLLPALKGSSATSLNFKLKTNLTFTSLKIAFCALFPKLKKIPERNISFDTVLIGKSRFLIRLNLLLAESKGSSDQHIESKFVGNTGIKPIQLE